MLDVEVLCSQPLQPQRRTDCCLKAPRMLPPLAHLCLYAVTGVLGQVGQTACGGQTHCSEVRGKETSASRSVHNPRSSLVIKGGRLDSGR